jgi:hypothetical protein
MNQHSGLMKGVRCVTKDDAIPVLGDVPLNLVLYVADAQAKLEALSLYPQGHNLVLSC